MWKKNLVLIILFLTSCILPTFANNGQIIRVGISSNDFSRLQYTNAKFSATQEFELIDKSNNSVILKEPAETIVKIQIKKGVFNVEKDDKVVASKIVGPIVIKTQGLLKIDGLKRVAKPALYRGNIETVKISNNNNFFAIVNVLDMQSYLMGVVPNEMPVRFGLEALKAQAIAAKNYALRPRAYTHKEFDVCDSVACQVYFGAASEKELANKAIAQTNNLVALHNGELILALYSSTAGGYTENYEHAFNQPGTKIFPANPLPYLKGISDNPLFDELSNEKRAKEFYISYPDTFDNNSPYFRWQRNWSGLELEEVIKNAIVVQSKTGFVKPALLNVKDFGALKDIKVLHRGVSGKIIDMNIVTDKQTFFVQKELVIRRLFKKTGKALPSANVVFDVIKDKEGNLDKVIAYGGGYGHGVGMSQYGAGFLSLRGCSFEKILKHPCSNV